MKATALVLGLLSAGCLMVGTQAASAQATRTWVSGVGDDVNPCSRTAPCKTWAGAISKTAAGGEIDALDPGGFGAVTITKAMTLDGGGGQVASTLAANTPGIVVSAGGNDVVIIRNVRLNGVGQTNGPGTDGVRFNSGKALVVENCEIFGWQNGIVVQTGVNSQTKILRTVVENSSLVGVLIKPSAAIATVAMWESAAVDNGVGVKGDSTAGGEVRMTISSSHVANNVGDGVQANAGAPNVGIVIQASSIDGNGGSGLDSIKNAAGVAAITIGFSQISENITGISSSGGGLVGSYLNNVYAGSNTSDGTGFNFTTPGLK